MPFFASSRPRNSTRFGFAGSSGTATATGGGASTTSTLRATLFTQVREASQGTHTRAARSRNQRIDGSKPLPCSCTTSGQPAASAAPMKAASRQNPAPEAACTCTTMRRCCASSAVKSRAALASSTVLWTSVPSPLVAMY